MRSRSDIAEVCGKYSATVKEHLPHGPWKAFRMSREAPGSSLKARLARNLQFLIAAAGDSQRTFADKAKMESKAFNNLVKGRFNCRLDTLERIAPVFGLQPWQLLAVDLAVAPAPAKEILRLVELYSRANPESRAAILSVASAVNPGE